MYVYMFFVVFFFFSSRRRHTRCLSDWSSDVCSSDLSAGDGRAAGVGRDRLLHRQRFGGMERVDDGEEEVDEGIGLDGVGAEGELDRSEERRVGKEGGGGVGAGG